jgi:RNA 3'-terminal phosphate cyclase
MIIINGSYGEGGGQILRSSLALSMITGQAIEYAEPEWKDLNPAHSV